MLLGIDYARQSIWERRQKEAAQARAAAEKRQEELTQALTREREQGYRLGYAAGVAEARRRTNGKGRNWMFGGYNDGR